MTMPDGGVVGYTYDAANRLSRLASFLGEFAFSYDNLGNRTKLTYPNGVATSYGYDPAGRLTAILAQGGRRDSINSFNYTHDGVGNRLSKTVSQGDHGHKDTRYEYAYDATYQMTQSLPVVLREEKERERNHQAENFVYGAVGNRLRGPGHADASVYNELNQLLASRTEEFRYDANGNLIYKAGLADDDEDGYEQQGWSYEYDLENRLVKASKIGDHGNRVISFKYDPFGRRIEKRVEEAEHGETESRITTYVYDNEDIILEISGKNTSRYVHGSGIDEPLAVEQKRSVYFFHADDLGSIVNLTDQRGRVVQSYEYSSFGRMKEQGGEVKQPYGYTGREWDKELGLYYYRARYYDPKGGRFISKDPIGFAGGDVNLYRYVQNDPVKLVDPWGLEAWYNDSNHWTAWTFNPANIKPIPPIAGPFGTMCGAQGTTSATWIPDLIPDACQGHDDCYDKCAKNCEGYDCKNECDYKLMRSSIIYGSATYFGGKGAYDAAREKYGCPRCP
jgi:RHS repeat-associated protein